MKYPCPPRRRHRARLLTTFALLFPAVLAGRAQADELTIPNRFVNGQPADADQVNANFSAVEAAVDDNDARIDVLEASGADLTALQSQVDANSDGVSANGAAIGFTQSAVAGNAAGIATNADAIGVNGAAIGANGSAISSNGARIDANEAGLADQGGRITTLETNLVNGRACPPGEMVTGVGADGALACTEASGATSPTPVGTLNTGAFPSGPFDVFGLALSVGRTNPPTPPVVSTAATIALAATIDTADRPTQFALQDLLHRGQLAAFQVTIPTDGVRPTLELAFTATVSSLSSVASSEGSAPLAVTFELTDTFTLTATDPAGGKGAPPVTVQYDLASRTGTTCPALPVAYAVQPTAGEVPIGAVALTTSSVGSRAVVSDVQVSAIPFEAATGPCLASSVWDLDSSSGTDTSFAGDGRLITIPEALYGTSWSLTASEGGLDQYVSFYGPVVCQDYGTAGPGGFCWDYDTNTSYP